MSIAREIVGFAMEAGSSDIHLEEESPIAVRVNSDIKVSPQTLESEDMDQLLLELLVEELLILKKKYNVIRKTKIIKNINQNEQLETLNNQILEEFINKKTKLYIDNRLYLRKMILNNYKKSFEDVNKTIENKNIQKFICNVDKELKIIGITFTGKVFNIDWESNINNDFKLDNKILGNIDPNEIINFHSIKKGIKNSHSVRSTSDTSNNLIWKSSKQFSRLLFQLNSYD